MVFFDELGFRANYEVDDEPEYPGDGIWDIPEFTIRGTAPVAIVRPHARDPWLLATKFDSIGGLYATPDPDLLCVLDRGRLPILVDVRDPTRRIALDLAPIRVASALDEKLLLFAESQRVTAWAADGIRWVSEPVVADDLKFKRTDNGRIVCVGVDNYEFVEVVLDASTGRPIR